MRSAQQDKHEAVSRELLVQIGASVLVAGSCAALVDYPVL
jgi:hypothetical protein